MIVGLLAGEIADELLLFASRQPVRVRRFVRQNSAKRQA